MPEKRRARIAPALKKEREVKLEALGLRAPTCKDCRKRPVKATGRRCRPCALLAAKADGIATNSLRLKDSTPSHVRSRELAAETAYVPFEGQELSLLSVMSYLGRDEKKTLALLGEFGVQPRAEANSGPLYLGADLVPVREAVRERAAAWTRGERARPY